nr:type VI secretion system ImpA family N-terminal domain-containing protein [Myxococcota bacterium]
MNSLDVLEPALTPWIHPIVGDLPLGPDPRPLAAYQSLREEIAKLESPAAGPCRWELVERDAELVLASSKDLASAAYLAGALAQRRGIEGLTLGTALLAELLRRFDTLHPVRPRARANALAWFLDRAEQQALAARPSSGDRAHLARLQTALTALRAAAGERLGDDAPSTHRFAEAVQR